MILKDYPYWGAETLEQVREQLRLITSIRKDDITQFTNLTSVFGGGRKVGKRPTSRTDVTAEDKVNDVNWTPTYLYILTDNSGTAVWRRVALGSW